MKRQLPYYVLAAMIVIVGAVAFGFPLSSLWVLGFVLICPLMMMFMMSTMHGGGSADLPKDRDRNSRLNH